MLKLMEWKTEACVKVWKKTNWEKWLNILLYTET